MYHLKKSRAKIWAIGFCALALTACKKDGSSSDDERPVNSSYFLAANYGGATYLLTPESLEEGKTTIIGNGIELSRDYTQWINNGTRGAVGIIYNRNEPAIGVTYGLNEYGLVPVGNEFRTTTGFNAYGPFENYALTCVSQQLLADGSTGALFSFIDMNNNSQLTEKAVTTQNFTGAPGQIAYFSGLIDMGNGEFLTGMGMYEFVGAGSGGGAGSLGETYAPDSVWIAAFDKDLNVKRIYRDDRISHSTGRWRSAFYRQIDKDSEGNVYVFSGSYEYNTTKKAGALLIRNGATEFDKDYYFNIEDKADGHRFRRVWHVADDYFILEFYNDVVFEMFTPATTYGIVKMSDKSFYWLNKTGSETSFPGKDEIWDMGLPYSENGKLYFPIKTADASPTIYVIDPVARTAKPGLVIEGADNVSNLTRFEYTQ